MNIHQLLNDVSARVTITTSIITSISMGLKKGGVKTNIEYVASSLSGAKQNGSVWKEITRRSDL